MPTPEFTAEAHQWHALASELFDLDPVSSELKITDNPSGYDLDCYFDAIDGSIGIIVPPAPAMRYLPQALIHENAHRKRETLLGDEHRENSVLGFAIDEGLAVMAEEELVPDSRPVVTFLPAEERYQRFVDTLLLDMLFYKRFDSTPDVKLRSSVERYIYYGTREYVWNRAYKVGHFIVSRAMFFNDLSIHEALALPDAFYREFAEERL